MTATRWTPEQQRKVYGCTEGELEKMRDNYFGHPLMLAGSILSDAQHVIDPDNGINDVELARQFMNRAKHIIFDEMREDK